MSHDSAEQKFQATYDEATGNYHFGFSGTMPASAAGLQCKNCGLPIIGTPWMLGGKIVCLDCAKDPNVS